MCIKGLKWYTYFQSDMLKNRREQNYPHPNSWLSAYSQRPQPPLKNNFKGFLFIKIWLHWICIKSEGCSMLEYFCHLRTYSLFWCLEHCLQEVHSIWYGVHVFLVYGPTLLRQKLHDAHVFFFYCYNAQQR